MSWGVELWDCVELAFGQVAEETEDVCGVYGKFIKERGEVEKEYAKALRKLCGKYTSWRGGGRLENVKVQEEMTKERAFRYIVIS